MFSKLDQATIKKNWIEEMSEGVPKLDKSMAEETEEKSTESFTDVNFEDI